MNKGLLIATMGLGMLFAQAVNANEMVRYEHGMYIAANTPSQQDATSTKKAPKAKSARKHQHKHHYHKHHHSHYHKHHRHHYQCPNGHCHAAALPAHATLEDIDPKMDILDRERGARGRAGRGGAGR